MRKLHLISTICTAALLCSPVMAEDDKVVTSLSSWDADSDMKVSMEEWGEALDEHDLWENVDKNNNGLFDVEESLDKVLDYDMSMDIDDGGHIDRDEFTLGLFDMHDANDDDMLDEREFTQFSSNSEVSPLFMTN